MDVARWCAWTAPMQPDAYRLNSESELQFDAGQPVSSRFNAHCRGRFWKPGA